jgi:hypothetical protein
MAVAENELIDGLTFDEWLDMIPTGVESMTEAELAQAHLEADVRIAAIRKERAEKPWQAAVYGKKNEYSLTANYKNLMVAEPPAPYYSMNPTGTPEQDEILMKSIAHRNAGGKFYTAAECKARMRAAIDSMKNV